MRKTVLIFVSAISAFIAVMATANAAVITSFSDDFNSETLSLNYVGFANWNVTNGSVDLIGTPGAWPLCGGSKCVDLDGSTENAGDLSTTDSFAVGTYKLTFRLAGNQRYTSENDGVNVTFGDLDEDFSKLYDAPFELITRLVTLTTEDFLSFSHAGGDNVGLLLDDVNISAVPLPAALPLYGAGIAVMGFIGWRRKRKAVA